MIRTRLLLLGCIVIVFAAGVSVGLLAGRVKARRPVHRSRLASELCLTSQQQEQMGAIWSEVMPPRPGPGGGSERSLPREERDDAILALLTEQQRPEYDSILENYQRRMEELSANRRKAFDEAVQKTKQILTPEQAKKYDEMLRRRRERRPGPGGPRGFRPPWSRRGRRRRDAVETAPATETQPAPAGDE